jgi:chromosome segregation ATPase
VTVTSGSSTTTVANPFPSIIDELRDLDKQITELNKQLTALKNEYIANRVAYEKLNDEIILLNTLINAENAKNDRNNELVDVWTSALHKAEETQAQLLSANDRIFLQIREVEKKISDLTQKYNGLNPRLPQPGSPLPALPAPTDRTKLDDKAREEALK